MKNIDKFNEALNGMKEKEVSADERRDIFIGLIAGYLAIIADALQCMVGDTDGEINNDN